MNPSVLVTGGARRIGRRICEVLASSGWDVIVHSRDENDSDAIALADTLHASRTWGDLNDKSEVERLFERALSRNVRLSAIVNNASLFSIARTLDEEEEAKIRNVNFESPVSLTKLLHEKLLKENGCGSVVNLLDTRILSREFEITPYAKSKRELFDFTRSAAKEYAPTLRVNAVAPGPVLLPSDAAASEKGGKILLSFRPSADDVASAVLFLLNADSVTGQTIAVDSGQHLISDEIVR